MNESKWKIFTTKRVIVSSLLLGATFPAGMAWKSVDNTTKNNLAVQNFDDAGLMSIFLTNVPDNTPITRKDLEKAEMVRVTSEDRKWSQLEISFQGNLKNKRIVLNIPKSMKDVPVEGLSRVILRSVNQDRGAANSRQIAAR